MEGALKVGTTPGGLGGFRLGDPWRGLWRQAELELVQQELVVLLRLGVAGEDERAPVRGWKVDVQHLDGGELLKYGAGREPRRQRALGRKPAGRVLRPGTTGSNGVSDRNPSRFLT